MGNDSVLAISANSDCAIIPQPNTCNAPIQQSTTVVNSPDIFFVGHTHNPSKKHIPSLPVDSKCNMEVNHCTYRISGIMFTIFVNCIQLREIVKVAGTCIMVCGIMEKQLL